MPALKVALGLKVSGKEAVKYRSRQKIMGIYLDAYLAVNGDDETFREILYKVREV
jgi:hypothetical protein